MHAATRFSRSVGQRLKKAGFSWFEDDCHLLAASISYYSALSFFPLLLILLSVLGYILAYSSYAQGAQTALIEFISDSLSASAGEAVQMVLKDIKQKAWVGAPLGFVTLTLSAVGIFIQVDSAFHRIWKIEYSSYRPRDLASRFFKDRIKAFFMMLAMGLFIAFVVITGLGLHALETVFPQNSGWLFVIETVFSLILNFVIFISLYRVLIPRRTAWQHYVNAALIVAVLWYATRKLLTIAAFDSQYSAYGIVGAFIALMLWIFVMACVVLFGAEYIKALGDEKEGPMQGGLNEGSANKPSQTTHSASTQESDRAALSSHRPA